MKTFLAALAAGLIGGGAAIGVIALDLVPQANTTLVSRTMEPAPLDDDASAPRDYESEITDLKNQLATLEVRLSKADAGSDTRDEIEALRAEIAALKKAPGIAEHTAGSDATGAQVETTADVTLEFDNAVREVLDRVQEENVEQRRLTRQTERLEQLEAQKARIAEFIPTLVQNQAANLGINEVVVPDVSAALVTHAQYRAEIASEMQGLRIDDQEIDNEAYQQKFEELNQTTVAALASYVDQETAERLVNTISRGGRNNRNQGRGGRR